MASKSEIEIKAINDTKNNILVAIIESFKVGKGDLLMTYLISIMSAKSKIEEVVVFLLLVFNFQLNKEYKIQPINKPRIINMTSRDTSLIFCKSAKLCKSSLIVKKTPVNIKNEEKVKLLNNDKKANRVIIRDKTIYEP